MPNYSEEEKFLKILASIKMGQVLKFFHFRKVKESSYYSLFKHKNMLIYVFKEEDATISALSNDFFHKLDSENLLFLLSPYQYPPLDFIEGIKRISEYDNFEQLKEISFESLSDRLFGLKKFTTESADSFSKDFFKVSHLQLPPFENKFFTNSDGNCLQYIRFENKSIVEVIRIHPEEEDSFFNKSNGIWSIDFNSNFKNALIFSSPKTLSSFYSEHLPGNEFTVIIDREYSLNSLLNIFKFFLHKKMQKLIVPVLDIEDELFFLRISLDYINSMMSSTRYYSLRTIKPGRIYELSFSIPSVNYNIATDGQYYSDLLDIKQYPNALDFNKSFKYSNSCYKIYSFQFLLKKDLVRHYVKVISKMEGITDLMQEYIN